jgi:hypothetical protein
MGKSEPNIWEKPWKIWENMGDIYGKPWKTNG